MATITKRGTGYYVQVRKTGFPARRATFATKAEAKAWATTVEAELLAGKVANHSGKTFMDALERYAKEVSPGKRGVRWEQIRIEAFKRLPFAYYKLSDVTTPRLAEWRDDRLKSVKSSTVNREANLLSAIFEQARREWQWIDINPMRDVRRPSNPKHRERIFTDNEVSRIALQLTGESPTNSNEPPIATFQTKSKIIAQAFLFALETGMRRQEITGLIWDRIDVKKRTATLPMTKNGDARQVPLSSAAIAILEQQKPLDKPFPVAPDVLTELFGRACERAGIDNAKFHDARHTACVRMAKKVSVVELARIFGHRDLKSVMIYYNETAENLAAKLD